jgi:hypothetical protein
VQGRRKRVKAQAGMQGRREAIGGFGNCVRRPLALLWHNSTDLTPFSLKADCVRAGSTASAAVL